MKPWMLYAAGVLVAFLLWKHYEADLRNQGASREYTRALEQRNAKLEDEAGRIDTVYRTEVRTLTRWHIRYDSLRDTLRLTDTSNVRVFVNLADSTIKSCSAALLTCDARVALRDQRIAVLNSLLTAEKHTHPSWLSRTLGKIAWASAGYAAGTVLHK